MFVDERIFREVEIVKESMFHDYNSFDDYSGNYYELLNELARKQLEIDGESYDTEEEYKDAVSQASADIIRICRFDAEGVLYSALHDYYGGYDNMIKSIRCAVDKFDEDGYIYYVTGTGYDTISADLLNGSADGKERYKFIAAINHDNGDKEQIERYKNMAK